MVAQPPNLTAGSTLPTLSVWTAWFVVVAVGVCLLAACLLNEVGLMALFGLIALAVSAPLLIQGERTLLWSWLFLFPLVYYQPFRLSTLIIGERGGLVISLFLLLALPGVAWSFLNRWPEHRRLLPVLLPLWFLLLGFMISGFHFFDLLSKAYYVRDALGVGMVLYLMTVLWRYLSAHADNAGKLYRGLLILGMVNAVAIMIEFYLKMGLVNAGGFDRPMGIFSFPILASFIALTTLVMALYGFFTGPTRRHKLGFGLAILVLLLSLLMSLTKSSILQLIPLLGVWLMFLPRTMKRRALGLGCLFTLIFLAWEFTVDQGHLWEQLTMRFSRTDTLSIRQSAWSIVFDNLDWPTVLWGQGWYSATALLGTYNYNQVLFPIDLMWKGGPSAIHPHNAYLKYLYEMGLAGLAMLLSYAWLMLRGFRGALQGMTVQQRLAALSIGSLVLILLIASLTGSPMAENYTLLYFSTVLLLFVHQAGWLARPTDLEPPSVMANHTKP